MSDVQKLSIREWLGLAGIGMHILTTICGIVFFCIIKFNDLAHLEGLVNKLDVKFDENSKAVSLLSERIAKIEGVLIGKDKLK